MQSSENMDSSTSKDISLDVAMPLMREQLAAGGTVEFSPRGVSMLPMLRQGKDTVTLSAVTGKLKKYDLPLYVRDNGQYVLHRIVSVKDNYTCIGDNQFIYEKGVRQDQLIGVVTSFCRDGKRINVSCVSHRIYRVLWHRTRRLRRLWRLVVAKIKCICKN